MPIVTLTTDFGPKDYYSARIKGALLRHAPGLTLVDITHNIPNYDIVQAAFIFRNCWENFPDGSIHLLLVNDLDFASERFVLLLANGHFFIAPDNGLLPLVFDGLPGPAYLLPWPRELVFPLEEVCAHAVEGIINGLPPPELGHLLDGLVQRITFQPVISKDQIRGAVIYIDHYENVVVNIRQEMFEKVARGRPFALYFKRNDPLRSLSAGYSSVEVGEPLCWFNSASFLEIAINKGRAASLMGLKTDDVVQVDFLAP